jgi:hypothetical protein
MIQKLGGWAKREAPSLAHQRDCFFTMQKKDERKGKKDTTVEPCHA